MLDLSNRFDDADRMQQEAAPLDTETFDGLLLNPTGSGPGLVAGRRSRFLLEMQPGWLDTAVERQPANVGQGVLDGYFARAGEIDQPSD